VSNRPQREKIVCELSKVAVSGPLERYAEGFADELARQGYAHPMIGRDLILPVNAISATT